ncbi:MAG TPA: class I SAM-dependent methyltransferase [Acidimicrobiia bacterium]|nr:class I SAM-dependent methyltransferase [Acidimicrobiia bacterium]
MKLTGERPLEGVTPDSLLALHDAGYREIAARLGAGTVLDVGCGVGHETNRLRASDRLVVGVDYHAPTAVLAAREFAAPGACAFATCDGARLAIRDRSADYVCSSHIIEHFTDPERHVAELARVVRADGTAFVITPNAPADFENPFHVYLFEAPHLASLLALFFHDVTVLGLEGSAALHADFATRRASGERILRLDPFALRHRLPRRWYVWAYERALPVVYRVLGRTSGVGSGLDASHLTISDEITPTTPVLFAVARRPRARVDAENHPDARSGR